MLQQPIWRGTSERNDEPSQMYRPRNIVIVVSLVALAAALFLFGAPAVQRSLFYPTPRALPPVVSEMTEQLLHRLELVLQTNAPAIAVALQPGLSDAQITALETSGGFRLSEDLKTLYRWRNGMKTNTTLGLLPGHRFLPLDEAVAMRASTQQTPGLGFKVLAGHRRNWLPVFDDGAGDGCFYDPDRADAQGAFFYYFAEMGYYEWFPSLRNFLAGVVECYETGAIKVTSDDKGFDDDADRKEQIWKKLRRTTED